MTAMEVELSTADARRYFHSVYLRTTRAVEEEVARGGFRDAAWLTDWGVAFADLYIRAFEAWDRGEAPRAWNVPFSFARDQPQLQPLRHVLFGMNVHINFDLPQALLAAMSDDEFEDPQALEERERDHLRIDTVLARRIATEDRSAPGRTLTDRLLAPLNHRATRRFLREAREKVWANARALSRARRAGPAALAARIDELDRLCEARVADLVAPGFVILKLARRGFGVVLPET